MMADTITHLSAVPTLLMAGVLFGVFLIAGVGIAWLFDGYRRRIPQAVLADRLDARVAESKEQLTDLEGKISAARQILGELDKNKAEAEFWADRVARSMQEWKEMGDRRAELERLQEEVRDAVEAAAEKRDEFHEVGTRNRGGATAPRGFATKDRYHRNYDAEQEGRARSRAVGDREKSSGMRRRASHPERG